jgi:N-acetylmuramic acid 6-phosphate (MurNAc-6-P) etherase
VASLTGLTEQQAEAMLRECGGELKTAVVAARRGVAPDSARKLLTDAGGQLRRALTS